VSFEGKISQSSKTFPPRIGKNGAMNISISLGYRDPIAAMRFLIDALGFEQGPIHDGSDGVIHHAELRWPAGGVIHVHSAEPDGNSVADLAERATADGGYPAVTIHMDVDDPDPRYERAVAAGARIIREVQDSPQGVGTRGFIVADPEGLYWSLGTPLPKLTRTPDGQWVPAEDQ
jgi:uncharacterized glyoxalase superfamily protein PhnB